MNKGSPSIACIGVINKNDNPLHISLFPPTRRSRLDYHFLLNSSLDIFEARLPSKPASHDFGLLQAVDERLAMYGWLTNTAIKFVIIVDMQGRPAIEGENRSNVLLGIRDADLRPAFRACHRAYIGLLRNPFYEPEEPSVGLGPPERVGSMQITSPRFIAEMRRIGETWYPGIAAL